MTTEHRSAGERPQAKLGVALGGGGARGLAHIGVWRALHAEGLHPSAVAGVSAGAIVASLWAAQVPLEEVEELPRLIGRWTLIRPSWSFRSLLSLRPARRLLERWLEGRRLEELPLPCALLCADLRSGEPVVLRRGPVLDAVLASSAVPGVFPPVEWEGKELIDGGVVANVPVDAAREAGAEVVVAVDLGFIATKREEYRNVFHIGLRALDMMGKRLWAPQRGRADVLLKPDVERMSVMALHKGREFRQAGENEARERMDEIRGALEQGGRRSDLT